MPKQTQTSLDAFFGANGSTTKKKNPQTLLDSFFTKKGDAASTAVSKRKQQEDAKDKTGKENSNSEEETENKKLAANDKEKRIPKDIKRRRLAIEDESDDDDDKMETTDAKKDENPKTNDAGIIESGSKKKDEGEEEEFAKSSKNDHVDDEESPHENDKDSEMPDAADNDKEQSKPINATKPSPEPKTKSKVATVKTNPNTPASDKKKSDSKLAATTRMAYSELCEAFEKINGTTKRLEIQAIVTELFQKQIDNGTPEDMYPMIYLCCNMVAPKYECIELGVGDSILIKAISDATGKSPKVVKAKYEEGGDLGDVAASSKTNQKSISGYFTSSAASAKTTLTCQEILTTLRAIADMKGGQSQKLKTQSIKKLLVNSTHALEPKFIIRALQGKLRIGLQQTTVLVALAHALAQSIPPKAKEALKALKDVVMDDYPEEAKEYCDKSLPKDKHLAAAVVIVKRAYSEVPSYDKLLDAALTTPLQELHKACTLTPGIPVEPMLAKPAKSVQEVLKRLSGQRFTLEYKYDGERAQVHMLPDGSAKVFSRNLLDTSQKYPEAPLYVKEAADDSVESFLLDTEVVAYDSEKDRLVPFQVLSTRKKSEESGETAKVKVIVQAFDLMYLNGVSLLNRSLLERRELLRKHFSVIPGKFCFAVSLDHQENGDTTIIEEFLDQAIKGQCEGLMCKTLETDATYMPSKRSLNWLKLKKDYLDGVGDSFDLVPIGGYFGKGKRTGVYGAYLMACFDPDTEEFQSVCKIGTGFSDENLKLLSESLNKHQIPKQTSQYNVSDQLSCDVWFDAVQVWEVKAADLSKSSAHRGASGKTGEEGRGIGLRFPRFERVRDDKKPEDATTSEQVLEMYYNQDTVNGDGAEDDDDGI